MIMDYSEHVERTWVQLYCTASALEDSNPEIQELLDRLITCAESKFSPTLPLTVGDKLIRPGKVAAKLNVVYEVVEIEEGGNNPVNHGTVTLRKINCPSDITEDHKDRNKWYQNTTFFQWNRSWTKVLLEEQEPLGDEFEQVLSDNLWDLYQI
jgi:hypothetical protein